MNSKSLLILISVAAVAAACGDADPKTNGGEQTAPSNGTGTGDVTEILPDGYDSASAARFSPDGTRLAMIASVSDETSHLITTDLEGRAIEVLVTDGLSYLSTIAWMPDGEALVHGGDDGIVRINTDGSEPSVLIDQFAVAVIDLSPDGQQIVWSVNGPPELTSAAVGEEPVPGSEWVDGPEGRAARFSPGGDRIVFVVEDGFAISPPGGDDQQIIEAETSYLSNADWLDDDILIGLTESGVQQIDITTGESTELFDQFAAMELDVSPDGSKFVLGVNGGKALKLGGL